MHLRGGTLGNNGKEREQRDEIPQRDRRHRRGDTMKEREHTRAGNDWGWDPPRVMELQERSGRSLGRQAESKTSSPYIHRPAIV